MVAKLVVAKGKTTVKEIPLVGPQTIIGRRNDCNLRIPSTMVSRQHCTLMLEGERLLVRDLGSSNGTFVNGSKVKQKALKSGDTLGIGPVTFIVQLGAAAASPSDTARPGTAVVQAADDAADFVVEEESAPEAIDAADFVVDEEVPAAAVDASDFVVDEEAPAAAAADDFVVDDAPMTAVDAADFAVDEEPATAAEADFVVAEAATEGGELDFVVAEDAGDADAAAANVDFVVADEATSEGDTVHDVNVADFVEAAESGDSTAAVAHPADETAPAAPENTAPPKKKGGFFGMFKKKPKAEAAKETPASTKPIAPAPPAPPAKKAAKQPAVAAPEPKTPAQSDEPDFFTTDDASEKKTAGEDDMADFLMGLNEKED